MTTYTTTVKVYKSGNSKVISIPKSLNIPEGEEFILKATEKELVFTKMAPKKEQSLKALMKLIGMSPGSSRRMDIHELEEFLESVYE